MEAAADPREPGAVPARGGYEAYDAILADDLVALREELGDVLLQVVLHARLAEDAEDDRWTSTTWPVGLVDKMIRRNPHVFAGEAVDDVEEIIDELGADQEGGEGPRLGRWTGSR